MHWKSNHQIPGELRHGHSGLIWLLDEVDAHLRGLSDGPEHPEEIAEGLVHYVQRFCEEVIEHVEEEEEILFPLVRSKVSTAQRQELDRLMRQHRALLVSLHMLAGALPRDTTSCDQWREGTVERLHELSAATRTHLVQHSRDERRFMEGQIWEPHQARK